MRPLTKHAPVMGYGSKTRLTHPTSHMRSPWEAIVTAYKFSAARLASSLRSLLAKVKVPVMW